MTSALIYATALVAIRGQLVDVGSVVFHDDTVDAGMRMALGDLTRAIKTPITLDDFDSATSTTIPDNCEDIFIRGSAGYAGLSRALDRADMASLSPGIAPGLEAWAKLQLDMYFKQLQVIDPGFIYDEENRRSLAAIIITKTGKESSKIEFGVSQDRCRSDPNWNAG